jgi:hypothetical protein
MIVWQLLSYIYTGLTIIEHPCLPLARVCSRVAHDQLYMAP